MFFLHIYKMFSQNVQVLLLNIWKIQRYEVFFWWKCSPPLPLFFLLPTMTPIPKRGQIKSSFNFLPVNSDFLLN